MKNHNNKNNNNAERMNTDGKILMKIKRKTEQSSNRNIISNPYELLI